MSEIKSKCIMLQIRDAKDYDDRTYCQQCDGNIREGDCGKTEEYWIGPDGNCVHSYNTCPGPDHVRIQDYLETHERTYGSMLCLICDKEIQFNDCNAPDDGTVWQSTGNYGSTVYDSISQDTYLKGCICDECLIKKKANLVEVVTIRKFQHLHRKAPL